MVEQGKKHIIDLDPDVKNYNTISKHVFFFVCKCTFRFRFNYNIYKQLL